MLTGVGGARRRVGVLTTTMTATMTAMALVVAGAAALAAPATGAPAAATAAKDGAAGLNVDPPPPVQFRSAPGEPDVATHALADTFALHSLPGSDRTIWLDLDGGVVEDTVFNDAGVPTTPLPPYDADGDPAFSDAELATIQSVWARVAEDFAPFDVDVTTEEPDPDALTRDDESDQTYGVRVMISPSDEAAAVVCGNACGGAAYGGIFDSLEPSHSRNQPAWVFPQYLGTAKAIADASSHEVGHTLGLGHDGAPDVEYYEGQGAWAPIMGASYYRPISQWSIGDYPGATNTQDDLADMATHGVVQRPDEDAGGVDGATGFSSSRTYVISSSDDFDYIRLGRCLDGASYQISPAAESPNLNVYSYLTSRAGRPLAIGNPPVQMVSEDEATGLDASIDYDSPGDYWLVVAGVGDGNVLDTGFSRYGSIGAYTVTGTACAPSEPTALATTSGTDGRALTLTWQAPVTDGDSPITGYTVTIGDGAPIDVGLATSHTFTGLEPGDFYLMTVTATNAVGTSYDATTGASPTGLPDQVTDLQVTPAADGTSAEVTWSPPVEDGGTPITGYVVTRSDAPPLTVAADAGSYTWAGLEPGATYTFSVLAQNAAGYSALRDRTVTMPGVPTVGVPSPPRQVPSADPIPSLDSTAVRWGWLAPGYDGGSPITGYEVTLNGLDAATLGPDAGEYTFTGLRPDNLYVFSVRARNAAGLSEPFTTTYVTPEPARVPDAPLDLVVTPGSEAGSAELRWSPPPEDRRVPVTGFVVTVNGVESDRLNVRYASTLRGLAPGATYSIGVAAENALGTGAPATVTLTVPGGTPTTPPPANPPTTPTTVPGRPDLRKLRSGRPGGRSTLKVAWSPPASTGGLPLVGHRVIASRVGRDGKVTKTVVSDLVLVPKAALRMTLKPGRYVVTVVAVNALGQSQPSETSRAVRAR